MTENSENLSQDTGWVCYHEGISLHSKEQKQGKSSLKHKNVIIKKGKNIILKKTLF
jgi:hypothetical protein